MDSLGPVFLVTPSLITVGGVNIINEELPQLFLLTNKRFTM